MTDVAPAIDEIARAIAEHSRADEFPKYADDPSIYRNAVEGAIANLCKARRVKQRMIVYRIQNIAWNTAERAGTLADVREILSIANDEISAIRENNAADDKKIELGKTSAVRLATGENIVKRETVLEHQPTSGKVEGGPFGSKPLPPIMPLDDDPQDNIDTFIDPKPDDAAPADEPPTPKNDWALVPEQLGKWQGQANAVAFDKGIPFKEARTWWCGVLNVPDETQIAMKGFEAIDILKAVPPTIERLEIIEKAEAARQRIYNAAHATNEKPVRAVDMQTGEILDAAIVPYEPQQALERVQRSIAILKSLNKSALIAGTDYGPQPGSPDDKPVLKKPGAEKLVNAFRLCPRFEIVSSVERWEGPSPLFNYQYRCALIDIGTGNVIATANGSCNTMEKKYRWRWVQAHEVPATLDKATLATRSTDKSEFVFAVEKAETTGKYGKPASYWKEFTDAIANGTAKSIKRATQSGKQMDAWEIGGLLYRIPNDEVYDLVNTVDKMAQKRALIAAVLIGCNASEFFTQDMEDDDAS